MRERKTENSTFLYLQTSYKHIRIHNLKIIDIHILSAHLIELQ